MSRRWLQTRRRDYYYRKAKEMEYRSRAAFKLIQINQRFKILRKGSTVLDLGAAPGGWLQVAREAVGPSGKVVGVDLNGIPPLEGVETVRGDIRDRATVEKALSLLGGKADVVLSDMSPNISGNYPLDHARSADLVLRALEVARSVLTEGGVFVAKIFEGDMLRNVLAEIEKSFSSVKLHSPKASRPASSEIYIIARGFLPSERID